MPTAAALVLRALFSLIPRISSPKLSVTKDVPPYAVVGGLQAKVIRSRFHGKTVEELMEVAWWRFSPDQLNGLDPRYPLDLAAQLSDRIGDGLQPFTPAAVTYDDFKSYANTVG